MRLILLILLTLNLLNAQKIALFIGNDDYSFAPLSNPLNDVDGLYNTLKEIGFDISSKDVLKNASQDKMQKALANFSQRAKNAEIALIYFSGHGMQVNNKNYMLPARTNPQKPVDLWGLVNLDYFIQSATSAKYGIVLVDACRDNPLVKYFQNGKHKGTNAKKGLGQVTPTVGQVVIGFATSAGDTADDGNGNMSPYAKALSVRLKEPNKDITKVLGLVALDVSAKYEQHPIIRTNLAYDVWLNKYEKNLKPKIETLKKPILLKRENINSKIYSIPNIEGRYDLISMIDKPKEEYKNNTSYKKQYNYLAGTMIIQKLDDNKFGYYYATKIKELSPNSTFGILKFKENKFKNIKCDYFITIDSNTKQVIKMIEYTANQINTSFWKKANPHKKISPYLRRILSKTKTKAKDRNWIR